MLVRRRLMREQRVPDVVVLVVVLVPGAAASAALHELHEQFPMAHLLVLLLPRGSSALTFLIEPTMHGVITILIVNDISEG
jgi:hypothetical protein